MPPRPFPFPLRIGNDICNSARIKAAITRQKNDSTGTRLKTFLRKLLTRPERVYFWSRFGKPEEIHLKIDKVSEFLAGRFAAKEACRKACHYMDKDTRGFQQIMILPITRSADPYDQASIPRALILDEIYKERQRPGRPDLTEHEDHLSDYDQRTLGDFEGQLCEISISHDGGFATAVALVPHRETGVPKG